MDERVGYGDMSYNCGDHYTGQWEHDQKHGPGVITYANGSHFEGEFAFDMRIGGRGTMNIVQEMTFNYDLQHDIVQDPSDTPPRTMNPLLMI